MNCEWVVMYWLAGIYLRYEYIYLLLQKTGLEVKKYGFENFVYFPFGVGREGFGADEDRPGNPVDRD